MKLGIINATALNVYESKFHQGRDMIILKVLGEEVSACPICGHSLDGPGRTWKEDDEDPYYVETPKSS